MATYEQADFDQIATAIGMEGGQIAKHENLFEAAALWYRLNPKTTKSYRPVQFAPEAETGRGERSQITQEPGCQ
jgi:hypothetical protein